MDELVQLENVGRSYPMDHSRVTALEDVSLRIGRGEFVAVAGPSGRGKSTLLNLIGCIDSPTCGRVLIDGAETSRWWITPSPSWSRSWTRTSSSAYTGPCCSTSTGCKKWIPGSQDACWCASRRRGELISRWHTTASVPSRNGSGFSGCIPAAIGLEWFGRRMSPKTILVVDDRPGVRSFVRTALRDKPYRVVFARGGLEALCVCACRPVDLLLVGTNVPDIGGIRLAEKLSPRFPAVPVLYLASDADQPAANDVIPKPLDAEVLKARIGKALESSAGRRRSAASAASLPARQQSA
jgi:CheY-like chemotaxis protein